MTRGWPKVVQRRGNIEEEPTGAMTTFRLRQQGSMSETGLSNIAKCVRNKDTVNCVRRALVTAGANDKEQRN